MGITSNTYPFEGKVVIVTGAARGIGRSIARAFAENGATVVASDIDVISAKETIAAYPGCISTACDVSDEESCKNLIQRTVKKFGRLDVLMNNAGIFTTGPFTEFPESSWHKLFAVNVDSLFYLAKFALPHLVESKGNIVQTASVSGVGGDYRQHAYNATKHAVVGLIRCLAIDYGPMGVRVNGVAPCITATDLNRSVWTDPEKVAPFVERIPLGRIGQVDDIARAACFLASDDAGFITGQVLCVDGGTTASCGQAAGEYDE